jgi:hypothetical protein
MIYNKSLSTQIHKVILSVSKNQEALEEQSKFFGYIGCASDDARFDDIGFCQRNQLQ